MSNQTRQASTRQQQPEWTAALVGLMLLLGLLPFSGIQAETVCAQVKLEIQQELTLERQAFDAMMRINNGLDSTAIEDVNISVSFRDEQGVNVSASSDPNDTSASFFIRLDRMDNITDVSGTGAVAPATTAEIHWLIIPAPGAAGDQPAGKLFFVGATLSYSLAGEIKTVQVTPDFITVKPLPKLTLDYFLTREVVGDDPLTPEIEPSEPYTLGVRISNNGIAEASQVKIDSAQPRIVSNDQGLPISFTILGASVQDAPVVPDLRLDFGTIPGNSQKTGRWSMLSSLAGQFIEFNASFSHADELGGQLTSLLEATNTHFLVRDVRVDLLGRDSIRDFLTKDLDLYRVYESSGEDNPVTDQSTQTQLSLLSTQGDSLDYQLSHPAVAGFTYVSLPDPHQGTKAIHEVLRSDGKRLSQDNAWLSRTRNRDTVPPSWDYKLNLFDVNSNGQYQIRLGAPILAEAPPVFQAIADQQTFEGNPTQFSVFALDPNGDSIQLTATPPPAGATFVDQGDGSGIFSWTPEPGQAGLYTISYHASDGALSSTLAATLKVNPDWDTDGDGLDDAWELLYFGNLDQDGEGDYDGDGVSNAAEYLADTDPTRTPGPGEPLPLAPEDGSEVTSLTPEILLLNANHSPGSSVTYVIELYNDPGYSQLAISKSGIPEGTDQTGWTVDPPLADNSWYYWRARAFNGVVYGDWVTGYFFVNTQNDPPGPMTISEPGDGHQVTSFQPRLAVTNSTDLDEDALRYSFVLASNSSLTQLIGSASDILPGDDGTTAWLSSEVLLENSWYYWQASVTDEHGATTLGPVSSFFVNTVNDAPSQPLLIAPAVGAEVAATPVRLQLAAASDPDGDPLSYFLELDRVNTFDSPALQTITLSANAGQLEWSLEQLEDNSWYHWRVRTWDGQASSDWLNGHFFRNLANDPPSVPRAHNPGDQSWVGVLQPTLSLNPVLDVDEDAIILEYQLYRLDKDQQIRYLIAAHQTDQLSWLVEPALPEKGWHGWRARAIDEHGLASDWMSLIRFYVDIDGINDPPYIQLQEIRVLSSLDSANPLVELRWQDRDSDSNAQINLYYSNNSGMTNRQLIAGPLSEDADQEGDHYQWDLSQLPAGVYYVQAEIDDGFTRITANWPGALILGDGAGQPYIDLTGPSKDITSPDLDGALLRWVRFLWDDYDADSNAAISLYYGADSQGNDRQLIVDGIAEDAENTKGDSYRWDISALPVGDYYLFAEIHDQDDSLLVRAPGMLHILVSGAP